MSDHGSDGGQCIQRAIPNNPIANEGRLRPVLKLWNGRFCSDHERHVSSEVTYR
jgi:hypothetical protein